VTDLSVRTEGLHLHVVTEPEFTPGLEMIYRYIPRFTPKCLYRTWLYIGIWTDILVRTEIRIDMPVQNRNLHRGFGLTYRYVPKVLHQHVDT